MKSSWVQTWTLIQIIKSSILSGVLNMNLNALWGSQQQWEAAWQFLSGQGIPRWELSHFPQKQTADMGNCQQQQIREARPPKLLPGPYTCNAYQQLAATKILNESRWCGLTMTCKAGGSLRSVSNSLSTIYSCKKMKELQVFATELI